MGQSFNGQVMSLRSAIRGFFAGDAGAVTVDWVMITAATTGLAAVVVVSVGSGTGQLGARIGSAISLVPVSLSSGFQAGAARMRELVSMHFSDGDTTGWSSDRLTSNDELGTFLGPFAGSDAALTYGVTLPHGTTEARIGFDLLILDSWDGDSGPNTRGRGDGLAVMINGTEVAFEHFMHSGRSRHGEFLGPRSAEMTIDGTRYITTMELQREGRFQGTQWTDQVWRVEVTAANPPPGGFTFGLNSTTDQSVSDESYGVTAFSVQAK